MKKKAAFWILTCMALAGHAAVSCVREAILDTPSGEIVFRAQSDDGGWETSTKATPVTSMASFNVAATTGSAGSESSVWNNVTFSGSPTYTGGKTWPADDPSYHFYASNVAMTFTAVGTTVSVISDTDVLCAYLGTPTYNSSNLLTFNHVLGRIGNVTVSSESGDVTLSNVSVTLIPKVSGTYNMRTGAWSGTSSGSSVQLSNSSGGVKANDVWVVPDTYEVSVSWRATKGGSNEDYDGWTGSLTVPAGKVLSFGLTLGMMSSPIEFTVSIEPWTAQAVAVDKPAEPVTFKGLQFAQGNLYHDGNAYHVSSYPLDGLSNYGGAYYTSVGQTAGSYYHTWDQLASYFCPSAVGTANEFTSQNTVDGGWRVPTSDEMTVTQDLIRAGSYFNGIGPYHYVYLNVNCPSQGLMEFNHYVNVVDYSTSFPYNIQGGILLLPDYGYIESDATITGWDVSSYSGCTISKAHFDSLLEQGCVFLPFVGYGTKGSYAAMTWTGYVPPVSSPPVQVQPTGVYLLGSSLNASYALSHSYSGSVSSVSKSNDYLPVRLVRGQITN